MTASQRIVRLDWRGPFAWPGAASPSFLQLPEAQLSGLYSWGIDIGRKRYLMCGFGITRNSFASRIGFHNRSYRDGRYAIYDCGLIKRGIRKDIWRGLWWEKDAWTKGKREYNTLLPKISSHRQELLASFRIFVAPVTRAPRILERIESALYDIFRADPEGAGIIIDEGWTVSYKFPREKPFVVHLAALPRFKGLPRSFEA